MNFFVVITVIKQEDVQLCRSTHNMPFLYQ